MTTEVPRASLLGLPPELRLRIYHFIVHADINCMVLKDIEHTSDAKHGTQARLIPDRDANLKSDVPWIHLQLVCRTLASELRSFMTGPSFLNDENNRAYILDMDVYNEDKKKVIRQATWRKLPCAPSSAQSLIFNVATLAGAGPWTDGGAASLARAIFQVLNHTCHNGPRMVRRQQLHDTIHIRDLIIYIDVGSLMKPPRSFCNADPRFNYEMFVGGFKEICKIGYLFGQVENIKIRNVEHNKRNVYDDRDFTVQNHSATSVPGAWKNYGFYWGV